MKQQSVAVFMEPIRLISTKMITTFTWKLSYRALHKDQVNVTLEEGVLRINAQRQSKTEDKRETHLTERRFTRVSRAFTLPTAVNEDRVKANLTDGVLHLTLSKREEVKPRRIQVQ